MIVWQNRYFLETLFDIYSLKNKMAVFDTGFNRRAYTVFGIKNRNVIKKFGCSKKSYGQ